jgi:hypothetical protein
MSPISLSTIGALTSWQLLGEVAAEEPSIQNVLQVCRTIPPVPGLVPSDLTFSDQFMLILWPPWSIWADVRSYINVSGTDDFVQRLYILLTSILLVGYTAQAAGLKVK